MLIVKHKTLQRGEVEAARVSLTSPCGHRFVPARNSQTQIAQRREETLIIIIIVIILKGYRMGQSLIVLGTAQAQNPTDKSIAKGYELRHAYLMMKAGSFEIDGA